MTYEYADRVEEIFTKNDVKIVRLTRLVTGMSANATNETNILMDSEGKQGPAAIFIENSRTSGPAHHDKCAFQNPSGECSMTEIFRCLAGSRLYGTHNANSDYDYKAVHLPTKRQLLLGKRDMVINTSTGPKDARNSAGDVDVESFELQYFLKLASDMQTIPVEMLFVMNSDLFNNGETCDFDPVWVKVMANRDKILNGNTKVFVGYCKGQAVRYSMRGKRLATYEAVCAVLKGSFADYTVGMLRRTLEAIEGVKFVPKKQPDGHTMDYLDVYGRQCPETLSAGKALKIYQKPVNEAGDRARRAKDAGGVDCKALYHAVRIANEGIELFGSGEMRFPCSDLSLLTRIRSGEVEIDDILDIFDEKLEILEDLAQKTPLSAAPDREWIDDFVCEVYEDIIRGQ